MNVELEKWVGCWEIQPLQPLVWLERNFLIWLFFHLMRIVPKSECMRGWDWRRWLGIPFEKWIEAEKMCTRRWFSLWHIFFEKIWIGSFVPHILKLFNHLFEVNDKYYKGKNTDLSALEGLSKKMKAQAIPDMCLAVMLNSPGFFKNWSFDAHPAIGWHSLCIFSVIIPAKAITIERRNEQFVCLFRL